MLHENQLTVGNVGDSRCVLCRNGIALEMSMDHKPEDEHELNRIHKAGGKVTCEGRVNGGLNLSRALGMLHTVNDLLNAPFQINASHLISAPLKVQSLY